MLQPLKPLHPPTQPQSNDAVPEGAVVAAMVQRATFEWNSSEEER